MKKKQYKKTMAACPAIMAHRMGALDKGKAVETRNIADAVGLGSAEITEARRLGYLKKHAPGGGGAIVVATNLQSNATAVLPLRREKKHISDLLEENRVALLELKGKFDGLLDVAPDAIRNSSQTEITEILRSRILPKRRQLPPDSLKRLHLLDEKYVSNKYFTGERFEKNRASIENEIDGFLSADNPKLLWKLQYMPQVLLFVRGARLSTSANVLAGFSRGLDENLDTTKKTKEQLGTDLLEASKAVVESIKTQGKTAFTDVNVADILERR